MCEGAEPGAMWAGLDSCSILLQVTARGGGQGLLGRRQWLADQKHQKVWQGQEPGCIVFDCPVLGEHFTCVSPSICTILITSIFAVPIFFSYLIAVSSELFISQPVIFASRASSSPLWLSTVEPEERGGEVWKVWVVELNWGVPLLNHDRDPHLEQVVPEGLHPVERSPS